MDNAETDKNTDHSFLELYEKLLSLKKDTAKNVLEIGIWDGSSLNMWHDYFPNAKIIGLDIEDKKQYENERITCELIDQSSENALNEFVLNYAVNQVYGEAEGYMKYKRDASTLVIPLSTPILSYSNDKQLELKPWF